MHSSLQHHAASHDTFTVSFSKVTWSVYSNALCFPVYTSLSPRHSLITARLQPICMTKTQDTIPCFVPDRSPHVTLLEGESAGIKVVHRGARGVAEGVPSGSALQHIRQASQGSLSHRFLHTLRLTVQVRPGTCCRHWQAPISCRVTGPLLAW